jgi:hypothetical protein
MHNYNSFASLLVFLLSFAMPALARQHSLASSPQNQSNMPDMPGMDMKHDAAGDPNAARAANDAMCGSGRQMNAHMFMTDLRPRNAGDDQRSEAILETLRVSIAKYKHYNVALADSYQIFLPNIPQSMYHFTNYSNGLKATFSFDPAHPTSLLYKKTPDGYELIGAMYTDRRAASEEELNGRVPLSVARWHKHVNFCLPPFGTPWQEVDWKKFGLEGSIVTKNACMDAGGRWIPQVLGWMVHVYPFETDPSKQWAH